MLLNNLVEVNCCLNSLFSEEHLTSVAVLQDSSVTLLCFYCWAKMFSNSLHVFMCLSSLVRLFDLFADTAKVTPPATVCRSHWIAGSVCGQAFTIPNTVSLIVILQWKTKKRGNEYGATDGRKMQIIVRLFSGKQTHNDAPNIRILVADYYQSSRAQEIVYSPTLGLSLQQSGCWQLNMQQRDIILLVVWFDSCFVF